MLNDFTGAAHVYIACGYTDIRKGIDGLAVLVQQHFQLDPCSDALFLFCGRKRDRIKALYWEGDGFVLLYKRLENGKYQWPRNSKEARQLTAQQYLTACLEDGRLEISNNRAERSIKPFVIDRKNFLFANTPGGAQGSAIIFSMIETAKENGLDPYKYLLHILQTAPAMNLERDVQQLLPWNVQLNQ